MRYTEPKKKQVGNQTVVLADRLPCMNFELIASMIAVEMAERRMPHQSSSLLQLQETLESHLHPQLRCWCGLRPWETLLVEIRIQCQSSSPHPGQ